MISGFCHKIAENCALLGYYIASSGNFLLMFQDNLSVASSGFKILEDGIDRLSPNVAKILPLLTM
jgi:hypothetical protein